MWVWHAFRLDRFQELAVPRGDFQMFRSETQAGLAWAWYRLRRSPSSLTAGVATQPATAKPYLSCSRLSPSRHYPGLTSPYLPDAKHVPLLPLYCLTLDTSLPFQSIGKDISTLDTLTGFATPQCLIALLELVDKRAKCQNTASFRF